VGKVRSHHVTGDGKYYVTVENIAAVEESGSPVLSWGCLTHAGRRMVGLTPTREDVAFVRARLIKKEANAQIGSVLIPLGLIVLVWLILDSFQFDINITL
jgi:hypothetical protein